tara:strand:- start:3186 stop:4037 length:852 start_codon:yes stop_codon:yes gene_type:complete
MRPFEPLARSAALAFQVEFRHLVYHARPNPHPIKDNLMTRKPALTSRLLGLAFGLLAWAAPLQAKEAETHALDGLKALKLSGGLTFEVTCGQAHSATITSIDARAFKTSLKDGRLSITRKSFRRLLSFGKNQDQDVHVQIQLTGDLPHLDLTTGTRGTGKTCSASQSLLEINASTGSRLEMLASNFGELAVTATTGSDVEIVETVTARQLFVTLSTGSQFYGGPKLQATAARVDVTTGGDANVCGAALVTGKTATGGAVRVSNTATVEVETNITGGEVRRGAC